MPARASGGHSSEAEKSIQRTRDLRPITDTAISWEDLPGARLETGRDNPLQLAPILNHSKKRGER